MTARWTRLAGLLVVTLWMCRCYIGGAGLACDLAFPCPSGFSCDSNDQCVAGGPEQDAGPQPQPDGGPTDAGPGDAGPHDAGPHDAGVDAGSAVECNPGIYPDGGFTLYPDGGVDGMPVDCPNGQVCNLNGFCTNPRYTEDGGIVYDEVTQLQWEQQAADGGIFSETNAVSFCDNLNLGGTGWMLPTLPQLFSIVDTNTTTGVSNAEAALDPIAFPNAFPGEYWSSTLYPGGGGFYGWTLFFGDGNPDEQSQANPNLVRCMR